MTKCLTALKAVNYFVIAEDISIYHNNLLQRLQNVIVIYISSFVCDLVRFSSPHIILYICKRITNAWSTYMFNACNPIKDIYNCDAD